ncbi:12509_t:CDS:2 [Ambispora leptoticha]|uniref:12509_t:CDS:1 n=1 Tax=Ambispora leptoticha TaxID=144679 RepID=A0A9N9B487_9GLOM|nr:12509_t:CDS:2 [Ambispora leptoticha]
MRKKNLQSFLRFSSVAIVLLAATTTTIVSAGIISQHTWKHKSFINDHHYASPSKTLHQKPALKNDDENIENDAQTMIDIAEAFFKGPKDKKTLYELISSDKRFTVLAKLVDEDEKLIEVLNKSEANLTLFAPVDSAFDHVKHWPSKECIRKAILYHIVPKTLCSYLIRTSRVLNSSITEPYLNDEPQKLRVGVLWRKRVFINYAKVTDFNLRASNGLAHAIEKVLIPPPNILIEAFLFPTHLSTFTSAIQKVGIADIFKDDKAITLFLPTNAAFARLSHQTLFHLFGPWGKKDLEKLLLYHISTELAPPKRHQGHFELKSYQGDPIKLDTMQFGRRYLKVKVNGDANILVTDAPGKNGVVHLIDRVLFPPDLKELERAH